MVRATERRPVVVTVVGARPQFVKAAPLSRALRRRVREVLVHTGQHYDHEMSQAFFDQLGLPAPDRHLGIGSGSHGRMTGRMLEALEAVMLEGRPDMVVVYGDTNSTLAGALAAAKLHIPVAHVEAGLRSFNRRMPEELNRIATDHLSEILFAPTRTAIENLTAEGLQSRALLTGDVMYDAVSYYAKVASTRSRIIRDLELATGEYGIATIHRAENTTPDELGTLLRAINDAASRFGRIIFPMHPRTSSVLQSDLRNWRPAANLVVTGPLSYLDMLALIQGASWVLTDSGGLQKEAFFLS